MTHYLRAPTTEDDGFIFDPYQMPHPLVLDEYPDAMVIDSLSEFQALTPGAAAYDNLLAGGEGSTETGSDGNGCFLDVLYKLIESNQID